MIGLLVTALLISPFLALEVFRAAKDSLARIDIYDYHTVIESWLENRTLYGFYMNSVVQIQTPVAVLATGICEPYAALRFRGLPSVISKSCYDENFYLVHRNRWIGLPFSGNISQIRYDFQKQNLFLYQNGIITRRKIAGEYTIKHYAAGPLQDFYVSGDDMFFLVGDKVYRNGRYIDVAVGRRFGAYYIPSAASKLRIVACVLLPLIVFLLAQYEW